MSSSHWLESIVLHRELVGSGHIAPWDSERVCPSDAPHRSSGVHASVLGGPTGPAHPCLPLTVYHSWSFMLSTDAGPRLQWATSSGPGCQTSIVLQGTGTPSGGLNSVGLHIPEQIDIPQVKH